MTQSGQDRKDNQTWSDGQKWEEQLGKGRNKRGTLRCRLIFSRQCTLHHQKVGTPISEAEHKAQTQDNTHKVDSKGIVVRFSASPQMEKGGIVYLGLQSRPATNID